MRHEKMIRLYESGEISRAVLDEYEDKLLMESRAQRARLERERYGDAHAD